MILAVAAVAAPMESFCTEIRMVPALEEPDNGLSGELRKVIERSPLKASTDELTGLLSDAGYLDSRVTVSGDTAVIETGPLFKIGDISLSVVFHDSQVVTQDIPDYRGLAASRERIGKIRHGIVSRYNEQGYYFASLNTGRVVMHDDVIDMELKLIAGPPVSIDGVRFKGLNKTNPDFVRKLAGLREGDLFVEKQLELAVRNIETGGYLKNDSTPQLLPNENYDGVQILFHLAEMKSNSLELGGGYLPRQGKVDGEFVGRIDFRSVNLFGSGRRVELFLDRKDRASSRVRMLFAQPFFIPDHMELTFQVEQTDYDSSYHSFMVDGDLSLYTAAGTRLSGGLLWSRIEPQRSSQPPSRSLAGVIRCEIQRLDYAPNPSAGRSIQLGFSYVRRSSRPDTTATALVNNETLFEVAADNYFPFFGCFVFRLNFESRIRITARELIDFSEQFKVGGFGSLRGYRQDRFAGRRTFLGQGELRLRPSPRFAFYMFADLGIVYSKKEIFPGVVESDSLTRPGFGLGLFVGGDAARMTLELGWGRDDRLDDGKVHLGLATLF
jgi:outer membrane protein assembly factor BamA